MHERIISLNLLPFKSLDSIQVIGKIFITKKVKDPIRIGHNLFIQNSESIYLVSIGMLARLALGLWW